MPKTMENNPKCPLRIYSYYKTYGTFTSNPKYQQLIPVNQDFNLSQ